MTLCFAVSTRFSVICSLQLSRTSFKIIRDLPEMLCIVRRSTTCDSVRGLSLLTQRFGSIVWIGRHLSFPPASSIAATACK